MVEATKPSAPTWVEKSTSYRQARFRYGLVSIPKFIFLCWMHWAVLYVLGIIIIPIALISMLVFIVFGLLFMLYHRTPPAPTRGVWLAEKAIAIGSPLLGITIYFQWVWPALQAEEGLSNFFVYGFAALAVMSAAGEIKEGWSKFLKNQPVGDETMAWFRANNMTWRAIFSDEDASAVLLCPQELRMSFLREKTALMRTGRNYQPPEALPDVSLSGFFSLPDVSRILPTLDKISISDPSTIEEFPWDAYGLSLMKELVSPMQAAPEIAWRKDALSKPRRAALERLSVVLSRLGKSRGSSVPLASSFRSGVSKRRRRKPDRAEKRYRGMSVGGVKSRRSKSRGLLESTDEADLPLLADDSLKKLAFGSSSGSNSGSSSGSSSGRWRPGRPGDQLFLPRVEVAEWPLKALELTPHPPLEAEALPSKGNLPHMFDSLKSLTLLYNGTEYSGTFLDVDPPIVNARAHSLGAIFHRGGSGAGVEGEDDSPALPPPPGLAELKLPAVPRTPRKLYGVPDHHRKAYEDLERRMLCDVPPFPTALRELRLLPPFFANIYSEFPTWLTMNTISLAHGEDELGGLKGWVPDGVEDPDNPAPVVEGDGNNNNEDGGGQNAGAAANAGAVPADVAMQHVDDDEEFMAAMLEAIATMEAQDAAQAEQAALLAQAELTNAPLPPVPPVPPAPLDAGDAGDAGLVEAPGPAQLLGLDAGAGAGVDPEVPAPPAPLPPADVEEVVQVPPQDVVFGGYRKGGIPVDPPPTPEPAAFFYQDRLNRVLYNTTPIKLPPRFWEAYVSLAVLEVWGLDDAAVGALVWARGGSLGLTLKSLTVQFPTWKKTPVELPRLRSLESLRVVHDGSMKRIPDSWTARNAWPKLTTLELDGVPLEVIPMALSGEKRDGVRYVSLSGVAPLLPPEGWSLWCTRRVPGVVSPTELPAEILSDSDLQVPMDETGEFPDLVGQTENEWVRYQRVFSEPAGWDMWDNDDEVPQREPPVPRGHRYAHSEFTGYDVEGTEVKVRGVMALKDLVSSWIVKHRETTSLANIPAELRQYVQQGQWTCDCDDCVLSAVPDQSLLDVDHYRGPRKPAFVPVTHEAVKSSQVHQIPRFGAPVKGLIWTSSQSARIASMSIQPANGASSLIAFEVNLVPSHAQKWASTPSYHLYVKPSSPATGPAAPIPNAPPPTPVEELPPELPTPPVADQAPPPPAPPVDV